MMIEGENHERPVKAPVLRIQDYRKRPPKRLCNLCNEKFQPKTKYERFCEKCRGKSELYHFAEWLSA